jgi:hypothetical protein
MKNNLVELKRQLVNEVRDFSNDDSSNDLKLFCALQKKEKNKLLEKLRLIQKSALEAQHDDDEYKVCGAGFKMKC